MVKNFYTQKSEQNIKSSFTLSFEKFWNCLNFTEQYLRNYRTEEKHHSVIM